MEALVTILLVEDNELVRKALSALLEMKGYKVLEANGAQEAQEISQTYGRPIHLLITDVVMPQTSGSELVRLLTPYRPLMRVLFISGYSEEDISRNFLPPGAAFLQKPVLMEVLLCKIRELLDS